MLKMRPKSLIAFLTVITLCTCIDRYSPKLSGYTSLLVVDGLITDANTSYAIKLSRTFQEQIIVPIDVSDAKVSLSDDEGTFSNLVYKGHGIYKTDSSEFKGIIGRTYVLHILTAEGEEYISEPGKMEPVAEIDNIYFSKDQHVINNGTQTQEGISIFLDSKEGGINQNYRWAFTETWKFKVPNPKKFNFNMADSAITPNLNVKEYCWKNGVSNGVMIHSVSPGEANIIKREPIFFIATDKSDRLLLQYSILVRQYSISKKEYEFWNNLKQVSENGQDIFAKQPYSAISNISNVNNPKERVLGFFQVSAVKEKRKNILFREIVALNLPFYHYPCERLEKTPADFQTQWGPMITWDDVYKIVSINSNYDFIEPVYSQATLKLEKMVFSKPECANCELTGVSAKPDFWIDLN